MENLLWYKEEANAFEEAMPIGNGTIGAMVYGKCDIDKISLNHDCLWSGSPKQFVRDRAFEAYNNAQKLVLQGRIQEAEALIESGFTGDTTQSYLPLGNLYISSDYGKVSDYKRNLDIENGLSTVEFKGANEVYKEHFVSYVDKCVVTRIVSKKNANYEIYYDTQLQNEIEMQSDMIILKGVCPSNIYPVGHPQGVSISYDGESIRFTTISKVVTNGDILNKEKKVLTIENATEIVIFTCICTSFERFNMPPKKEHYNACLNQIKMAFEKGFNRIKKDHIKDFSLLFNRVRLDLNAEMSLLPTDKRLEQEEKDLGLYELLFNFGRYLIISSSRDGSRATNLQGIWNESLPAPWYSNYTVNINTQMNYWPVLMCNLVECNQPMIEFVQMVSETGRVTAKHFYHAEGFVCHHNVDLWGHSNASGSMRNGSCAYAFWNMSSGWLCRHLFEHYEYTLDREFLEKIAYPVLKECAMFYLSILIKYDGNLIISPATSPENRYMKNGVELSLAKWTTMSQSIVYDLFLNYIRCCEILGIDNDFKKILESNLEKIKPFQIGTKGQLLEWDEEYEEQDIQHRHLSHLYGLYPAELITNEKLPHLANACRRTLELRGDNGTGWSLGWKVNLWARLKEGEHALKMVNKQLKLVEDNQVNYEGVGGTYKNMFNAHPPFQIDGNFAVVSGIAQMFMQCENNKIKLLPALPDLFKNGKISGLLSKGNITVGIQWENKNVKKLTLISPYSQLVYIEMNAKILEIVLKANEEYLIIEN